MFFHCRHERSERFTFLFRLLPLLALCHVWVFRVKVVLHGYLCSLFVIFLCLEQTFSVLPSGSFVIILLLISFKWFWVSCVYGLSSGRKGRAGRFSAYKNSILLLWQCYKRIGTLVPINKITLVINSSKRLVCVHVLHFTWEGLAY